MLCRLACPALAYPPYDPTMITALLLYGDSRGIYLQPHPPDLCLGRSVLSQFRVGQSHGHYARYQRHGRCVSWPPADVPVQRPKGRILLPAPSRLRRRHGSAICRHPTSEQDAIGQACPWLGQEALPPPPLHQSPAVRAIMCPSRSHECDGRGDYCRTAGRAPEVVIEVEREYDVILRIAL